MGRWGRRRRLALRLGVWWWGGKRAVGVVIMVGRVSGMVGVRRRGRRAQADILSCGGVWCAQSSGLFSWICGID